MEKHFDKEECSTLEKTYSENILMTQDLLERFPKHFQHIVLDDNTEVAILYKNPLLPEEVKDTLAEYEYFALSKYGLSQFSNKPLNWYMQKDAIQQLVQKALELEGDFEEVPLEIRKFVMKPKTRKTKGLRKLEAIVRPFQITGQHSLGKAKTFYNDITILLDLTEELI